jgi:hypothetical protein
MASPVSTTITVTGGSGSYSGWGIWAGGDPPGVNYGSLGANPLTLSGTPTTAGTYNVTWANCDAVTSQCASQPFSITIGAALSITTASLPNGSYGVGYSQSLSASGGTAPYTWAVASGSLPNGLTLSAATISGTPSATGTWNFTVQATDSTSPTHQTATKALSIHINALPSVGIDGMEVFWGASGEPGAVGTSTAYYTSTPQVFGSGYAFGMYALGPDATIGGVQILLDGSVIATPTYGTASRQDACNFVSGSGWPGCPNVGWSYNFPASSYSVGPHTLAVRATDANGLIGTASFPITIMSTMSVTASALSNGLVNSAYSQSLAATGGTASYTWSIVSGALPTGLSLSAGGTISGTPTSAGAFNFTVQATDTASPTHQTASKAFSILINSVLGISTASLPGGIVTTSYSQTLAASGGAPGYTWSLTTGSLPPGLTLNTSGNIFGTPTTAGTSNFTVQVADNTSPTPQTATKALSITVGPALAITTSSLPNGLATTSYSQTLTATGGTAPYSWSLSSGSLPAGLSLSGTGTISGTATTGGTYGFTVKATDSTSPTAQTAIQALSITITPAFSIVTTTLPNGVAGAAYSQTVTGTGGTPPYSWTVTSGTLPGGLTLSSAGTISGTPSVAGTFNFTVKGSDSSATTQSATQPLSIAIGAALTITTTSLPNALANSAYSQPLAASGGTTPYAWSITAGALPSGLTLTPNGSIYGTPNASGTFNFATQVTDSTTPTAEAVTKALALTVGPALTITTASLATATVGAAYSQTLAALGGTPGYTWSMASGNLPPGLSLSTGGVISGTPATAGFYNFVVKVTDTTSPTAQTATQALGITTLATLAITTASLPNGLATAVYSQVLGASGGTPPYTWAISSGSAPAGLALNASGVLSGTPTTAGTSTFTAKVTDNTSPTPMAASQSYTITTGAATSITTTSLPNGIAGSPYAQVLAATGGTTPYTWSLVSGTLPAGLTLTPGGAISGIPTTAGPSNFTVKATDSTSPTAQTATKSLSITITAGLTITTTSLPGGLATTTYSQALAASGGTSPYTWTITSGSLPNGLTLSSTGAISGAPTVSGTFSFVVQATDTTYPNAQTASQALSITLGAALLITTQSLNAGAVGQSYTQTLNASGGTSPYTWSVESGQLPSGIALTGNTLSGTPTATGTSSFTLKVTDSTSPTVQAATASLSLTVGAAFGITSTSPLPTGLGGAAYLTKIQASGGTAPYTFTLASGAPPAGLTLESDGTLFGTPTTAGTSLFSVLASDSTTPTAQTQIKPFSLTITPPLSITTASLPSGLVASAYSQTVSATGGTSLYTWTISSGSLPPGLTLSSTGSIQGTPAAAGVATFTVQVTDSTKPTQQTATAPFSISVGSQLTITTASLPPAVFGSTYNTQLSASGGTAPYRWAIIGGNLPPGLSLSAAGYITGTCTSSGENTITVQVSDLTTPIPQTATRVLTVDGNTSLSITTGSLTPAPAQQSYSTSLTAAGGVPPYAWSVVAGSLPAGLILSAAGIISGTPTVAGLSTFSVQVTDSSSNIATHTFNLNAAAALSITTGTLPTGVTGSAYITSVAATGGSAPYAWSIASGNLPAGLSLSTTGIISGSPGTAGTATFTVQVADNSQPTPQAATKSFSISVTSPLTITTTALPVALTNSSYSQNLAATGGTAPYTWSLPSGQLPSGLTLSSSGTISGTPTTKGITNFTVQISDSSTIAQSTSQSFLLNVVAPLSVTTTSLPAALVGHGYNSSLAATGGQKPLHLDDHLRHAPRRPYP